MNRAVPVVVAALLAAACTPAPFPPGPVFTSLTFYWQFIDGDGNTYGDFSVTRPGCIGANVDQVRIAYTGPAGTVVQTVPCIASNGLPGVTFDGVPTGNYTWLAEGFRGGLTVFSIRGGGQVFDLPFFDLALEANHPNMDLFYELPPGVTCLGIDEIAFALFNLDSSPNFLEYSSDNVRVPCRAPPDNWFTMPAIPLGNYGYQFVAAVDAPPPAGRSLYQVCGLGMPPMAPLVQGTGGNAYIAPLALPFGTCP
jgi:hypothetical protein